VKDMETAARAAPATQHPWVRSTSRRTRCSAVTKAVLAMPLALSACYLPSERCEWRHCHIVQKAERTCSTQTAVRASWTAETASAALWSGVTSVQMPGGVRGKRRPKTATWKS
jgi:hypothetical protein